MDIEELGVGTKIKFQYWDTSLSGVVKDIDWLNRRCLVMETHHYGEISICFDDIESVEVD